jgi:hypothetical protein
LYGEEFAHWDLGSKLPQGKLSPKQTSGRSLFCADGSREWASAEFGISTASVLLQILYIREYTAAILWKYPRVIREEGRIAVLDSPACSY